MLGIEKIGVIAIIILAAFFVASFFLGRSLNYKIQRNVYRLIAQEIKPYFKKVSYSSYGSDAFSLFFPVKEKKEVPFKTLEATVLLMDRENIAHYLYSKAKGDCDKLIIKADLKLTRKHKFVLELVSRNSIFFKKVKKAYINLKEVEIENLTEDFLIKTSNPKMAKEVLNPLLKMTIFKNIRSYILRLSISPKKPHLILVYSIEESVQGMFRFLWEYVKMLNDVFFKVGFR